MEILISNHVISNPSIAFQDIWRHHPELQNWSSSSWWFFLLLPKQKEGYGPKQMMFTFASRVGGEIKINSEWQKGIDPNRKIGRDDKFMTTVVGWINDGKNVHEEVVHEAVEADLSFDKQILSGWNKGPEGKSYGASLRGSMKEKYGIDANFVGKKGHAKFKVWNPGMNEVEVPQIVDIRGPKQGGLGGTHLVAWRKFQFEGDFKGPHGEERLEGNGYFQRVLMNIPMPPWFWIYTIFEDGSIFSSFVMYFGFHNFRRNYKFFKQKLERLHVPIVPTAYFYNAKTGKITYFEKSTIHPSVNGLDHPNFYVHAECANGEYLKFYLESHNHAQFLLDRRILKRFWQSMFIYNEYMFKITKFKGRIDGKPFDLSNHGKGWGNIEYTWGMSL